MKLVLKKQCQNRFVLFHLVRTYLVETAMSHSRKHYRTLNFIFQVVLQHFKHRISM